MKTNESGIGITNAVVVSVLLLITGAMLCLPAYGSCQTLPPSQVRVIELRPQLVEVQGIADTHKIINATLTPLYLQHEAIQAQEKMAASPNHTEIYIPSGPNGIPLVKTVDGPQN